MARKLIESLIFNAEQFSYEIDLYFKMHTIVVVGGVRT